MLTISLIITYGLLVAASLMLLFIAYQIYALHKGRSFGDTITIDLPEGGEAVVSVADRGDYTIMIDGTSHTVRAYAWDTPGSISWKLNREIGKTR